MYTVFPLGVLYPEHSQLAFDILFLMMLLLPQLAVALVQGAAITTKTDLDTLSAEELSLLLDTLWDQVRE